jgi:Flp pilus assembly protein TadB
MNGDSRSFPRDGIRVSDDDRDQAVAELSEHFQSGRLTQDEFEDRSGQALQARTGNDLRSLFTDLPARPVFAVPQVAAPETVPVAGQHRGFPRVIPLAIAAFIVASLVAHGTGQAIGWLVPVLVVGLLFARVLVRRR